MSHAEKGATSSASHPSSAASLPARNARALARSPASLGASAAFPSGDAFCGFRLAVDFHSWHSLHSNHDTAWPRGRTDPPKEEARTTLPVRPCQLAGFFGSELAGKRHLNPFVFHDRAFWPDELADLRGALGPCEGLPRPCSGIVLPAGVTARRRSTGPRSYARRATISSMAQTWSASPASIAGVTRKV